MPARAGPPVRRRARKLAAGMSLALGARKVDAVNLRRARHSREDLVAALRTGRPNQSGCPPAGAWLKRAGAGFGARLRHAPLQRARLLRSF